MQFLQELCCRDVAVLRLRLVGEPAELLIQKQNLDECWFWWKICLKVAFHDFWELFIELDSHFENIAFQGEERLARTV